MTRPGVLVRITGEAPVQAKVYRLQKLRCHLCGNVFTAKPPEGVGRRKYDATAGSTPERISRTCWSSVRRSWDRRFKCVTR